jgi:hypothetical protein
MTAPEPRITRCLFVGESSNPMGLPDYAASPSWRRAHVQALRVLEAPGDSSHDPFQVAEDALRRFQTHFGPPDAIVVSLSPDSADGIAGDVLPLSESLLIPLESYAAWLRAAAAIASDPKTIPVVIGLCAIGASYGVTGFAAAQLTRSLHGMLVRPYVLIMQDSSARTLQTLAEVVAWLAVNHPSLDRTSSACVCIGPDTVGLISEPDIDFRLSTHVTGQPWLLARWRRLLSQFGREASITLN